MIGQMHLSPEAIVDSADGGGTNRARRHLDGCAHCRARLDDVRAAMALTASVDVPEPSPLFWDHLSARVGRAVADEPAAGGRGWWSSWGRWMSATTALALLILAIVVVRHESVPESGALVTPPGGAVSTAFVAPPAAIPEVDDGTWDLVTELSAELAGDAGESVALEPAPGMAERAIDELSLEEQGELVRLLEAELARRPS